MSFMIKLLRLRAYLLRFQDRFWTTVYGRDGKDWNRYLTRVYLTPRFKFGQLRLHIFHRGDKDPDCHDHPFNFYTFPLVSYVEELPDGTHNTVDRFKLHYRPAEYTHRVLDQEDGARIITLVWASNRRRDWGFWIDGVWIPWRDYIYRGVDL